METRKLGRSGIDVSVVGLGLWAVGGTEWGPTDDRESLELVDAALDSGVTFFDTADVYGDGHSEELLGRAMRGRRDRFVVATKIGWIGWEGDASAYDSPEKLIAGFENNLRRLQTDHVELLQCHIPFRERNTDAFLEGMRRLRASGKVRAIGVSTSDFEYVRSVDEAVGIDSLQIDYSLLNRTPEEEIFPYCQEKGVGVIVRGPLAMGLLTGKFSRDTEFQPGDFRRRWQENEDERRIFHADLDKIEKLKLLADGRTLAQYALRFVLAHPAVSVAIPGAKNARQLRDNLGALETQPLSLLDWEAVASVTPQGGGRRIWPA